MSNESHPLEDDTDPYTAGLDPYGRERCEMCREVLYPEEQVRYQLVGEVSPLFCAGCLAADFVEAGAGEPDSDGVPEPVGDEDTSAELTVRETYAPIGDEGLGDVRARRAA